MMREEKNQNASAANTMISLLRQKTSPNKNPDPLKQNAEHQTLERHVRVATLDGRHPMTSRYDPVANHSTRVVL